MIFTAVTNYEYSAKARLRVVSTCNPTAISCDPDPSKQEKYCDEFTVNVNCGPITPMYGPDPVIEAANTYHYHVWTGADIFLTVPTYSILGAPKCAIDKYEVLNEPTTTHLWSSGSTNVDESAGTVTFRLNSFQDVETETYTVKI